MVTEQERSEYFQALLEKNPNYEGVFFVGVKSTGIFCRPTCSARKPKFENCEFHRTAQEALLASFRPCLRCQPLSHPNQVSSLVRSLVEAVEADPTKRWTNRDFERLAVDASTARRQFQKRFGMTFVQYARARRMGIATKEIRKGSSVGQAQEATGYSSSSGFRDAFSKVMGTAPTKGAINQFTLYSAWIDTKLGPMLAIADEDRLYLLEFVSRRGLEREIEKLRMQQKFVILPGRTDPIDSIENELGRYFEGTLQNFETPIRLHGSDFQKSVWEELQKIPYGQTRSYAEQAELVGKPSAIRAVASANGANQLAIIVPCHRIVRSNGDLGGYGGGLDRKKWLLDHEQFHPIRSLRE
jgi:AraC family transcriptional regulator of adaptative response/methylated-DNA-[protein]-cysteine methyltransferase